jgi:hypothetical protein
MRISERDTLHTQAIVSYCPPNVSFFLLNLPQ